MSLMPSLARRSPWRQRRTTPSDTHDEPGSAMPRLSPVPSTLRVRLHPTEHVIALVDVPTMARSAPGIALD